MLPRILLSFCILLQAVSVFSQENQDNYNQDYYNRVGIRVGSLGFRMRDQALSRHLYQGNAVPIMLEYNYWHPDFKINFSNNFSTTFDLTTQTLDGFSYSGDLGTFIEDTIDGLDHKTINTILQSFNIDLLIGVKTSENEKLKFFMGGSFSYLFVDQKFLTLYYTNIMTNKFNQVGLSGALEYTPGKKHRFRYSISLPVLSRVNRTLTLQFAETNIREYKQWTSFNEFLAFDSKLVYEFIFARRWSLEGVYQFNYLQCSFPRKIQLVNQSFTAGINFYF